LNVQEQVHNLAKTSIVQQAWKDGQKLSLHGWVFDIATGEVKELESIKEVGSIDDIYRYDLDKGLNY
jgi:carbonic anhydrase